MNATRVVPAPAANPAPGFGVPCPDVQGDGTPCPDCHSDCCDCASAKATLEPPRPAKTGAKHA